jgi:hypothetical protein
MRISFAACQSTRWMALGRRLHAPFLCVWWLDKHPYVWSAAAHHAHQLLRVVVMGLSTVIFIWTCICRVGGDLWYTRNGALAPD